MVAVLHSTRTAVSASSNRHTLKPCATPASGANSTHPSPSARQFRLPFNGLAQSELRQIFCSDEATKTISDQHGVGSIGQRRMIASRLCDKAATGQSPRVLMKVENVVKVEPVDEFELKGNRRPLAAYNVLAAIA